MHSRRDTGKSYGQRSYSSSATHENMHNLARKKPWDKSEPTDAELLAGLEEKINIIEAFSTKAQSSPEVSNEDSKPVVSYSWLDEKEPIIIVPGKWNLFLVLESFTISLSLGCPPVWRDRTMPFAVPGDSGIVYFDQNAARISSSPLMPLISAISHQAPDFSLSDVDFVTDRNGLRKL